jgi:hypothetical protein
MGRRVIVSVTSLGFFCAAFFLAYWMVFCSPNDTCFRLLKQGALLVPMKALETVRYGVLISTLGMDKALNAEHPRMRQSVCLHLSLARSLCRSLAL